MFKVGDRIWIKDMKEFGTIVEINGDDYHSDLKNGIDFSHFDNVHQTADDMFEELGYEDCEKQDNNMIYKSKRFTISFDLENKEYWHDNDTSITVEEHQAIHQKMIELGWIE